MTKTYHIDGMACGHCEASVKKALETLPQVQQAKVELASAQATLELTQTVSLAELQAALEDYTISELAA